MPDILSAIVTRKRADVAKRLRNFDSSALVPSTRSLREALARKGARFIMEVKKKSPSGHESRHSLDQAVSAYAPTADAISVLTDAPFFGGSLDDLGRVRAQFGGPLLAKDFVVDPRQVAEARAYGADAVLAMMSVLDDEPARLVMGEAERLAMDVIVEVHDEKELERAIGLGAKIIGINNRNLRSLKTNLAVTERLSGKVPADVLLISESGISAREDVERLSPRVVAFLVGSSLMAADDIAQAARALVYGRVKICGLTQVADVQRAALAGATHAGFVFVPRTPRALRLLAARELAEAARRSRMMRVGIFRNAPVAEVLETADAVGLDVIQLHGQEPAGEIAAIEEGFAGEVWTACKPDSDRGGHRPLFDSGQGGSGRTFDWTRIAGHPRLGCSFLAGGIGPDNARRAQAVGTYGIDVGSRLESRPGLKDPAKVTALFDALRPQARDAA